MRILIILSIVASIVVSMQAEKKVVCYYGTWSVWRTGLGRFEVNDIDPTICTHIIYTFFGVTASGEVSYLDPYLDLSDNYGKGYISKFISLKSINPNVKLLAAFGGWNAGSEVFSAMASDESTRFNFAINVAGFLARWGFDGIDLDWEYPAQRGGNTYSDKDNFVSLLADLRRVLESQEKLIAIAVGATQKSASISYNIEEVVKYVDFVNLMAYDMHGSWEPVTGIHNALYASSKDVTAEQKTLNVDAAVDYWLSQGCPKEKLVLGIPLYGRSFTLANVNNTGIGELAAGPGIIGSFVPESGFLPYNELCYTESSWTRFWQAEQEVPYAVKKNQWVGYEDLESLEIKLNYILAKDLGGAMFWSVETDDFSNLCKKGKYPMISLAQSYMSGKIQPTATPTTREPTTTMFPPPTEPEDKEWKCPEAKGLFRDPEDSSKIFLCDDGKAHHFDIAALFKN